MYTEGGIGVHPQTRILALSLILRGQLILHIDPDTVRVGLVRVSSHYLHLKGKVNIGKVLEGNFHRALAWDLDNLGARSFVFELLEADHLRDLPTTEDRQHQRTQIINLQLQRPRNVSGNFQLRDICSNEDGHWFSFPHRNFHLLKLLTVFDCFD